MDRGAAAYLSYAVNDWLSPGLREEIFREPLWKPGGSLTIRSELRYDAALSSGTEPYSNRDSRDQFPASVNATFAF